MKKKSATWLYASIIALLVSSGCDLGTYNQRLNETNVKPPPAETEEGDSADAAAE